MNSSTLSGRQARSIVVVGSLNMDLVMRTARVPVGGETLHGHEFRMAPGGKGANQAVACARLGSKVTFIGQTGEDDFGKTLCEGLIRDGIDATGVKRTPEAGTGVAVILVEDTGQNRILLASGANGTWADADIEKAGAAIESAAMLIIQLEIPMPVVQRAVEIAGRYPGRRRLRSGSASSSPLGPLRWSSSRRARSGDRCSPKVPAPPASPRSA